MRNRVGTSKKIAYNCASPIIQYGQTSLLDVNENQSISFITTNYDNIDKQDVCKAYLVKRKIERKYESLDLHEDSLFAMLDALDKLWNEHLINHQDKLLNFVNHAELTSFIANLKTK